MALTYHVIPESAHMARLNKQHPSEIGLLGQSSVRVSIFGAIVFVAVLLIALFVMLPSRRAELQFAAVVIAGSATVYAAYHAASTLQINLHRDRQARAFAIVQSMNEQERASVRILIEGVASKRLGAVELYTKITTDTDCLASVTSVLGHYDDAAIAIREGWVDELVIFKSLGFLIPWTYNNLREYINEERRRVNDRRLYMDVEALAESWKNNRLLSASTDVPKEYQL